MPPGPPLSLKIPKLGSDFVMLNWKPPTEDGGSKVTGYKVEKCEEKKKDWAVVEEVSAFDTTCKVTGLKQEVGYFFQVSAKNKVGYGEPAKTKDVFEIEKPTGIFFVPSQFI